MERNPLCFLTQYLSGNGASFSENFDQVQNDFCIWIEPLNLYSYYDIERKVV